MKQFSLFFPPTKGLLSSTITVAAFLLLAVLPCKAELVDRVVAVVNDSVITMSEVDEEGKVYFRKVTETVPAEKLTQMLSKAREDVLNGLIDKALIKQKAKEMNVRVSDSELQRAMDKILLNNNLTPEQFKIKLDQGGINEKTYRDNLRSQLLQKKLVGLSLHSKIAITDDMILDYYDTHYTQHLKEDEYYLLQIGFTWEDRSTAGLVAAQLDQKKQSARERAERVHSLARQGNDFKELARKFSDLPSAEDGGDIGVFKKEDMAEDMSRIVTSLKQGEVSDIIETAAGFQFFKLLSAKDQAIVPKTPLESVKKEIENKLYQEKLQQAYKEWITRIKQKAHIQKM